MRGHHIYRHISCLDMDMYVHKITFNGPKYLKMRVSLLNRHNGLLYETTVVTVEKGDLWKWKFVV